MKITERYTLLYLRLGEKEFTTKDISRILNTTENNAKVVATRMQKKGMITKTAKGRYKLNKPEEYLIKNTYGKDIIGFMEKTYNQGYYITGPSALSYYGLASSREYYLTVEDDKQIKAYNKTMEAEIKTIKRQIKKENYRRTVFEDREANIATPETAITETLLMEPEIIQFYAIPAICDYIERGFNQKQLTEAAQETGTLEYLKKILTVLSEKGYKVKTTQKKPTEEERKFIEGGINA
ncbi:MAG: hypothetical protein JW778_01910 [Candidatus Altiarchaeota archaeon]|nr:hypothetical protein [Candidatus Altiarchaeota archaeon]